MPQSSASKNIRSDMSRGGNGETRPMSKHVGIVGRLKGHPSVEMPVSPTWAEPLYSVSRNNTAVGMGVPECLVRSTTAYSETLQCNASIVFIAKGMRL
jgi:hypothetical protein